MRWLLAALSGLFAGLTYPSPIFFFLSILIYELGILVVDARPRPRLFIAVMVGYLVGWGLAHLVRPAYHRVRTAWAQRSTPKQSE